MRIQLFAIQKYSQIKRKLDYREKNPLYGRYFDHLPIDSMIISH